MEQEVPVIAFVIIALLTPVIAFVAWLIMGRSASATDLGFPPKVKRNLIVLALAGPVNLLVWFVFMGWLDQIGSRSVIGYVLAALTFLIVGYVTGFLPRFLQRRRSGRE